MKHTLSVSSLIIGIALFSCHKNNDPSQAPPTPADSVKHLSTIFLASAFQIKTYSMKNYELVISEPGGKVLLDTMAVVNTQLNADLRTTSKTSDLSVIFYDSVYKTYVIEALKSIDPVLWVSLPGSDSVPGKPHQVTSTQQATIKYTHVPLNQLDTYFSSQQYAALQSPYYGSGDSSLTVTYSYPSPFLYLVFPKSRLYNLHRASGLSDVVDLSHMDTAVTVKFNMPANQEIQQFVAYGYPDTTAMSTHVQVSLANTPSYVNADLLYPGKKAFQKYYWEMDATDTVHSVSLSYVNSWCDTVTGTPFLPGADYFTIGSTANNNFSVQFNKQRPGYYMTQWNGNQLTLQLTAPSDSTILNPVAFVAALKSKLLAGKDPGTMKLTEASLHWWLNNDSPLSTGIIPPAAHYDPKNSEPSSVTLTKYFP